MVKPVCDLFGIVIDYDLDVMLPGQSIDHVTTAVLQRLPAVIEHERPDLVVVQGDTTTAFAAALSAFYHKVDVAHVEAGLRTHDLASPWPEEGNRALIGRLATYHFPPTVASRENLLRERVVGPVEVTGNTVVDAALIAASKIEGARADAIATRLGLHDAARPLILFTMHRRESHGEPVARMFAALRDLAEHHDVDVLFPVHPNPNIHGPAHAILSDVPNIRLVDPLDYDEVVFALQRARILITDSGGLAEEAPTFGTPALILRESTERPESIEAGGATLIGYDTERLKQMVRDLLTDGDLFRSMSSAPNPFGDGRAAERICDVLAGPSFALRAAA